jgi:hypothetical protein
MPEFNVWYDGMIVEHVRAENLLKARQMAKAMFSRPVVVTPLKVSPEETEKARAESVALAG